MPLSEEFTRFVGMSYEDTSKLSERLALDRSTVLYGQLRGALAAKLATMKVANEKQARTGRRRRIVVSQYMEPKYSHALMQGFSEFDLVFKNSERNEGGYTTALFGLVVEKLFNCIRGVRAPVVCMGFSLNHLVVHNRDYAHLCVPFESIDFACGAVRDDRAMCAILNAAFARSKPFPLMQRYAKGDLEGLMCSDPVTCKHVGKIGVFSLMKLDVPYLQVCSWMMAHQTDLAYIAFPCVKATELRYNATVPELEAEVRHDGDSFHILYKNAMSMSQTYSYKNHLSLIGKVYETIGEYTFQKEFVANMLGVSYYKITRVESRFEAPPVEYRSWMTPDYKDRYLVRSFDLRHDTSDPFDPTSYKLYEFDVGSSHIDKLVEDAMLLPDDAFTPDAIARKLRVYATNHVQAGYSIVSNGFVFDPRQFSHIVLAVYVRCFNSRYLQGVTAAFVAGDQKRLKYIQSQGALGIIPVVCRMVVFGGVQMGLSWVKSLLLSMYDKWFTKKIPMPQFSLAVDYISYRDIRRPVAWNEVRSWSKLLDRPWASFSPYVTGYELALAFRGPATTSQYNTTTLRELRAALEYRVMGGIKPLLDTASVRSVSRSLLGSRRSSSSVASGPTVAMSEGSDVDWESLSAVSTPVVERSEPIMTQDRVKRQILIDDDAVRALALKIVSDGENLRDLADPEYYRPKLLLEGPQFSDAYAGTDDNPLGTLTRNLGLFFPGSTLMQTDQFNADVSRSDYHMVARAAAIKISGSKLARLKPDVIYRPNMPNQVIPNVKQEQTSTLHTVVKRNLNTMSSVDPLDIDELWERTWDYMKRAYYVPQIEEKLALMSYIGPTLESAAVWASKLDPAAREQGMDTSYALETLDSALQDSRLMLKGKRKPNMGASFDVAVKASQSIQYDSTRARTAVYSPIFAHKVMREQSLLRENVFVLQSKSVADMNEFLARFDWRPNAAGPVRYGMLDIEMMDKSQIYSTLMVHWKQCEVMKVLPRYVDMLKENTSQRTASSVTAGVKVFLTPQRGSGDSDTLDGNSDVSKACYARFFAQYRDQIEFIMIMGDDVTFAYRGDIQAESLESDCMKEFNLSVKLTLDSIGEFVSGWLVHLPDGRIKWHTDPLKRAVSLGDQSVSEQVDFQEKWQGFKDLCVGLEGTAVQDYIAHGLVNRSRRDMGTAVTHQDALGVVRAVSTIAQDFDKFRRFFASSKSKRYN